MRPQSGPAEIHPTQPFRGAVRWDRIWPKAADPLRRRAAGKADSPLSTQVSHADRLRRFPKADIRQTSRANSTGTAASETSGSRVDAVRTVWQMSATRVSPLRCENFYITKSTALASYAGSRRLAPSGLRRYEANRAIGPTKICITVCVMPQAMQKRLATFKADCPRSSVSRPHRLEE
jgi:hypothetical protein